jgi:hypothetical protein
MSSGMLVPHTISFARLSESESNSDSRNLSANAENINTIRPAPAQWGRLRCQEAREDQQTELWESTGSRQAGKSQSFTVTYVAEPTARDPCIRCDKP